jgi:hypothetical protein
VAISIIKELAEGKRWKLPEGHIVAMGEDYRIGFY